MMNRKWIVGIALIIVIMIAAVAAYYLTLQSGLSEEHSEEWYTTLNIAYNLEPTTLDQFSTVRTGFEMMWNCYEPLVRFKGATSEIEGVLATDWTLSADGKNLTFFLRQGVNFHDGTPFNATAVKFAYDRQNATQLGKAQTYQFLDRVDVVDTYTVSFIFTESDNFFIYYLASHTGHNIASPSYVLAHATVDDPWAKEWMIEHGCGTGPYKLTEWVHSEYIRMDWFDGYWRGWEWEHKHIKTVIYRLVGQTSTQELLLMKGDIDIATLLEPSHYDIINTTEGLSVNLYPSQAYWIALYFDPTEPPFNDRRVREAVAWTLDYETIVTAEPGLARFFGMIDWGTHGENPNVPKWEANITKAKELLKDAGYLDSAGNPIKRTPLNLLFLAGRTHHRKFAEIIKANLYPLGFDVTTSEQVVSVLFASCKDLSTYDMQVRQSGPAFPHPSYFFQNFLSYRKITSNVARYNNSEVDDLYALGRTTSDPQEAIEAYKKIEKIVLGDDIVAIALTGWAESYIRADHMRGHVFNPYNGRYVKVFELWKEP